MVADGSYPRFDNSAVDGYVVGRPDDANRGAKLRLQGAVAAGDDHVPEISAGTAARILTGAKVLAVAYGVAMQEDVRLAHDTVTLNEPIEPGGNIRRRGTEIDIGQILVEPGTLVTAGVASLYALVGHTTPSVYERPRVLVLTTGDELVPPSIVPTGSQIRDTNSVMLSMLSGGSAAHLRDDYEGIKQTVSEASETHDMILLAGGASVGDRDYVGRVVDDLGEIYFHGVAIRPGKPILFGEVADCLVFGLPGNPTSAFVGFHIFANYALRIQSGRRDPELRWMPMETAFEHKAAGRTDFPGSNSKAVTPR